MSELLRDPKARFHLTRRQSYPWLTILLVALLAMVGSLLGAGLTAIAFWPFPFFLLVGLWLQTSEHGGEGISVFEDEIHFGGAVVARAEIDMMFTTGQPRVTKLWLIGRSGTLMGSFETDGAFAARTRAKLLLGGVRVAARSHHGFGPRCIVEATSSGISIRGGEHLRWDEIATIETLPSGFYVRRKSGGSLSFGRVRTRFLAGAMSQEVTREFVARANMMSLTSADATSSRAAGARVIAALEGLGPFRDVSLDREDLWVVVEDRAAPAELRAKAARELAKDPAEHPRLRVASEWCNEPKLRVQLLELGAPAEDAELKTYKAAR